MKKYITLFSLVLLAGLMQAADIKLRTTITPGVNNDTVLVYARSTTASALDMSAITTSLLFTQGGQVQGYESIISQQWGNFAELTQTSTGASKSYDGIIYDGMWQWGIAAAGNAAITIPSITSPELLILKVWITGANTSNYYLEDKVESQDMNEIESALSGEISYEVHNPGASGLPVEILSFEATAVDREVVLDWVTETETNNAGFEIEKSVDARTFAFIGFVEGVGTSSSPTAYRYTDAETRPGDVYYYRLKQVDLNGSFRYSNIAEVRFEGAFGGQASKLYPNPAQDITKVTLQVSQGGTVNWYVLNMTGQVVLRGEVNMPADENREVELGISDLQPGNYLVRFVNGKTWEVTRKLVVH